MKNKFVSIKNIADELKISISTVSFILNGKAEKMHISASLTQKVLDYARLVNYKPNRIAQSLRTGKSNILVFMVEDISDPFFSKLAKSFEVLAYNEGYKVVFCSTENDDNKTKELINFYYTWQAEGYVIVPSSAIRNVIEDLKQGNVPVILLHRNFENLDNSSIFISSREVSFGSVQYLQKLSVELIDLMLTLINKINIKRDR